MYKVAARLPTRLRYGLSGTPFQNDYSGGFVSGRAEVPPGRPSLRGRWPRGSTWLQACCCQMGHNAPEANAASSPVQHACQPCQPNSHLPCLHAEVWNLLNWIAPDCLGEGEQNSMPQRPLDTRPL